MKAKRTTSDRLEASSFSMTFARQVSTIRRYAEIIGNGFVCMPSDKTVEYLPLALGERGEPGKDRGLVVYLGMRIYAGFESGLHSRDNPLIFERTAACRSPACGKADRCRSCRACVHRSRRRRSRARAALPERIRRSCEPPPSSEAERSRKRSEFRIASSSSTTWTVPVLCTAVLLLHPRQREAENGAAAGFGLTQMRPPWASTNVRQIDKPTPMPCGLEVTKGWNRRPISSLAL